MLTQWRCTAFLPTRATPTARTISWISASTCTRAVTSYATSDAPVNDPAIEMVQRRARIRDLRAQISGLETDALQDDISANELANMGKNGKHKKDNGITEGITKVIDGVGTVVGAPARLQAPTLREEAARLREELAQLESLDQSSANVPAP